MKIKKNTIQDVENPFSLSIGDLMAALLLIFILLLASTLLKLQEEFKHKSEAAEQDKAIFLKLQEELKKKTEEIDKYKAHLLKLEEELRNKSQVAERYTTIKADIYNELMLEFKDDLIKWNAELDPVKITIRFKEPDVLFETGKYELKEAFKAILKDFFPRYINVLSKPEFKENIEEIRIEGHTDNVGDYYTNMKLSQDRTRSVLSFVLEYTSINADTQLWVKENLTANGLSFSKPIADNNDSNGRSLNRRVEFRIRTNAEKQIDEMLKFGESNNADNK